MGMKWLVMSTTSFGLVATLFLILVQTHVLKVQEGQNEELFVAIIVPSLIFVLALAIQIGYTAIFQAAFEDDRVLPFKYRASLVNIIILVSKTVTIGAPFVNELEEPIPLYVVIGI